MHVAIVACESQVINNTYQYERDGVLVGVELVFLRVVAKEVCSGVDL